MSQLFHLQSCQEKIVGNCAGGGDSNPSLGTLLSPYYDHWDETVTQLILRSPFLFQLSHFPKYYNGIIIIYSVIIFLLFLCLQVVANQRIVRLVQDMKMENCIMKESGMWPKVNCYLPRAECIILVELNNNYQCQQCLSSLSK